MISSETKKKIAIIGSANVDMAIKMERFPKPGETIIGGDFIMNLGGKGANQAVAAARLGGDVNFMCRLGDDKFGKRSIREYQEEGIRTNNIIVDQQRSTGVALIYLNDMGENKIVVASGANNGFTKQEIERAETLFTNAEIIVLQLEIPSEIVGHILGIAKRNGTKVILNPAPAKKLPESYYKDLYLITPNENEVKELTGISVNNKSSATEAASKFRDWGVQNVVITLGDKGAFLSNDDYTGYITTLDVDAVDTTAAGDIFNGALAVSLIQHTKWEEAVNFACTAAALSVTKNGAQSSAPTVNEIERFIDGQKKVT